MPSCHDKNVTVPRVSICMPVLNGIRYLQPRIESILAQIMTDWELIVCDGFSNDGTWESLLQLNNRTNVRLFQEPAKGIYAGINSCVRRARGEYVYIAPADDTMSPDCIGILSDALNRHPECDMAISRLVSIDEDGKEHDGSRNKWPAEYFYDAWLEREHVHIAPLDAVIAAGLDSTFISLTQIMTRRSLFSKAGLFLSKFGSWGDFEWNIRTALVCNRVYVPHYLATWRRSATQATKSSDILCSKWHRVAEDMIKSALRSMSPVSGLRKECRHRMVVPQARAYLSRTYMEARSNGDWLLFLKSVMSHPALAFSLRGWLSDKCGFPQLGGDAIEWILGGADWHSLIREV